MTSEERERILNEIRKAYTTKGYSQKVLQPFLDFAITYNFYAEKRDIVEAPQQEIPIDTSNQSVEDVLKRLPKANSRYEEEEVIDDDIPSDEEVASVVGGYLEENDAIL